MTKQPLAAFVAVLLALSLTACNGLDKTLDAVLGEGSMQYADQGYVHFDDTGNITVVMNNLEFKHNPLWNSSSYIGVYVFPRGADPLQNCCDDGFEDECSSVQENSCMKGMGFSNDLMYGGSFYLELHRPEPFDTQAPRYYMPVYVSDKAGLPQNYQGEYNHFSSPVNAVGDREIFDLYIGAYYSVADPNSATLRPTNLSGTVTENGNDVTYYSRVRPDYLSPLIRIESRFYSETPDDPTGSWYPIPHLASWTALQAGAGFSLNGLVINEVGFSGTDDFVEIYNPNGYAVDLTLAGARLMRDAGCSVSSSSSITETIGLQGIIPAGGYFVLAQTGHSLANVNQTNSGSFFTAGGGYCVILTNSSSSPAGPSAVTDWVTFGGTGTMENGVTAVDPGDNNSSSRCPNGTDTNFNNNDFRTTAVETPGAANTTCP